MINVKKLNAKITLELPLTKKEFAYSVLFLDLNPRLYKEEKDTYIKVYRSCIIL